MTTDAAIFNAVCDQIRNAEEHLDKPARIRTIMSTAMHRKLAKHIYPGCPPEAQMDNICGSCVTLLPSRSLFAVSFPQKS